MDLKSSPRAFPTEQRGPVSGLGRLGEGRDEPESGGGNKELRILLDVVHLRSGRLGKCVHVLCTSVMFNSLQPCGLWATRCLCP